MPERALVDTDSRDWLASPRSIGRIARDPGFADQSQFTRFCLWFLGLTPGECQMAIRAA